MFKTITLCAPPVIRLGGLRVCLGFGTLKILISPLFELKETVSGLCVLKHGTHIDTASPLCIRIRSSFPFLVS